MIGLRKLCVAAPALNEVRYLQVQEKEARIRVMMRMMGLGTAAYWVINYVFWVRLSVLHLPLFGLFRIEDWPTNRATYNTLVL
jgi:hypothetical protein